MSPSAANDTLEELFNTLELLAANPGIGQRRDDLWPLLRLFSVRPYVIMYQVAAGGIQVV
jgi:plasmid stabilization system protein ParE